MANTRKDANHLRDFERSLPMELLKARESAMARFRPMLRDHGLTEQQWRVIRALAALDQINASELARRSFLLAPSLTRILQYLEAEKLVKRSSDANDQRRAVFSLTAKGKKLFARVAPDSETLYIKIEQEFGADKLGLLYELLAEFYQTIAAEEETNISSAAAR
ncbi:MAG: homoprotocatechuate degradation operon regulator HpaR [Woeseia sp.]|jgi:homoprotocatechuate degradation regulator HpaR|nr:homoprotocatechuate degradation operon regulator HpaR [Woeseia sp.]MBT6208524.1 homoprotocatechuate degradation operon regulator HpaR [Woeseia sp.]